MNKIASILIVSAKGYLLLHQENDNSDDNYAGKSSLFSGEVKAGEVPSNAAVRVLGEEAGLEVRADDLASFDVYPNTTNDSGAGSETYVYVVAGVDEDRVHDYGGQGVVQVRRSDDFESRNVAALDRQYLSDYFKRRKQF